MAAVTFTEAERAVLAKLGGGVENEAILTDLVIPAITLRRHYENLAEKLLTRAGSLG